jgi:hypothetical protein
MHFTHRLLYFSRLITGNSLLHIFGGSTRFDSSRTENMARLPQSLVIGRHGDHHGRPLRENRACSGNPITAEPLSQSIGYRSWDKKQSNCWFVLPCSCSHAQAFRPNRVEHSSLQFIRLIEESNREQLPILPLLRLFQ